MKNAMIAMVLVLMSGVAHADGKVFCGLAKGKKTASGSEFKESLYYGEAAQSTALLLSKDGKSAKVLDFNQLNTIQKWQKIDGQKIYGFGVQPDGNFSLYSARVNARNQKEILAVDSMTVGNVKSGFLAHTDFKAMIMLSCYNR